MPRQRMKKQDTGFVQVKNEVLNDKSLSLKAKGLFAYLYGKPDTWDFSYERIAKDQTDGLKSVLTGIYELEEAGYLLRKKRPDGRTVYFLRWDKKKYWPVDNPGDKLHEPTTENGYQPKSLLAKNGSISNTDSLVIKKDNSNKERIYKFSPKSNTGITPIGKILKTI